MAKHRYSQKEEDLIWSLYTDDEKAKHNEYVLGYGEFTANTKSIDSLRNAVMSRKEQHAKV